MAVLQDGFESFCFASSSACSCALRRFLWRGTRRSRRRKGVVGDCCFCSLTSASDWDGESGELVSWKNFVIVTDSEGITVAAGMQGWDGCMSQLWAVVYDRTNELLWEVNCCCTLLVAAFAGDVNWNSGEWHITSWMRCATRWDDDFLCWRNIKLELTVALIIFMAVVMQSANNFEIAIKFFLLQRRTIESFRNKGCYYSVTRKNNINKPVHQTHDTQCSDSHPHRSVLANCSPLPSALHRPYVSACFAVSQFFFAFFVKWMTLEWWSFQSIDVPPTMQLFMIWSDRETKTKSTFQISLYNFDKISNVIIRWMGTVTTRQSLFLLQFGRDDPYRKLHRPIQQRRIQSSLLKRREITCKIWACWPFSVAWLPTAFWTPICSWPMLPLSRSHTLTNQRTQHIKGNHAQWNDYFMHI